MTENPTIPRGATCQPAPNTPFRPAREARAVDGLAGLIFEEDVDGTGCRCVIRGHDSPHVPPSI